MRGQDIANKVLPGLGYFIAFMVALGGLAFNIGNVGEILRVGSHEADALQSFDLLDSS